MNSLLSSDRNLYITVVLWKRKDGQPFSNLELLSIGNELNSRGDHRAPATFEDHVHSSVSAVKFMAEEARKQETLLNSRVVVKTFVRFGIVPEKRASTQRRFARMGLTFYRNHLAYDKFLTLWNQSPIFGVAHLESTLFHQMDESTQILALDCLMAYLMKPLKGVPRGTFALSSKNFFQEVSDLLQAAVVVSNNIGMPLNDLMKAPVQVRKTAECTVRDVLINQMKKFRSLGTSVVMRQKMQIMGAQRRSLFKRVVSNALSTESGEQTQEQQESEQTPARRTNRTTAGKSKQDPYIGSLKENYLRQKKYTRRRAASKKTSEQNTGMENWVEEEALLIPKKPETSSPPPRGETQGTDPVPPFDDSVPDPPSFMADAYTPYVPKERDEGFETMVNTPPEYWTDEENPLRHVRPVLDLIQVPNGHRSQYLLKPADIRRIHHYIWYRATLLVQRSWGALTKTVRPMTFKRNVESLVSEGDGNTASLEQLEWETVQENTSETAWIYFSSKAQELKDNGYCVFPGFMQSMAGRSQDDNGVPTEPPKGNPFHTVLKSCAEQFPGEEVLLENPKLRTTWDRIHNKAPASQPKDPKEHRNELRFITLRKALFEDLDAECTGTDTEAYEVLRCKAESEVIVCFLMHYVRMAERGMRAIGDGFNLNDYANDSTLDRSNDVEMPVSGCRVLLTGRTCSRQAPHSDFASDVSATDSSCSYFAMFSGMDPFCIWGWPSSHKHKKRSPNRMKALAEATEGVLVSVPKDSVLFGRADFEHAGAGYYERPIQLLEQKVQSESSLYKYRRPLRGHMYFMRQKDKDLMGDGIHMHSAYKVNWSEPETSRESDIEE